MDSEVIVAVISGVGTLIGSGIGAYASSKLTAYRIEQLEKKVEKHNQVVERTYKLEKQASVMHEQILVANHRIKDLEDKESEHE